MMLLIVPNVWFMALRAPPITLVIAVLMALIAPTIGAQSMNWPCAGRGVISATIKTSTTSAERCAQHQPKSRSTNSDTDPPYRRFNIELMSCLDWLPNIAFRFQIMLRCARRAASCRISAAIIFCITA